MLLDGTPYRLETMTLAHVPTVAAIEAAVFSHPWSLANFVHEVTDNLYSDYVVLRYGPWIPAGGGRRAPSSLRSLFHKEGEDRSIVGYGGLWLMVDEAHICTLAVRTAWRGRGLGELVLSALIEHGIVREASHATLEVRRSNLVAQNLYRKYGFVEVGVRKGYYLDNNEDALIMTTGALASEEYQALFARLQRALRERLAQADAVPPADGDMQS